MKPIFLLIALLSLFLISGCGGGGNSRLDMSGSGTLTRFDSQNQDGSVYDEHSFVAKHDGYIQVTMSSDDLDPYVVVYRGYTEDSRVGQDDDTGPGLDAQFIFYAERGAAYTAKFTTSESEIHTGDYHYTISEVESPRSSVVNDNPAAASAKVPVDPAMKNAKK